MFGTLLRVYCREKHHKDNIPRSKKFKLRRQVYFQASEIFDFINIFVEKVSNKTTQCKHEGTDNQSKQTYFRFTLENMFYSDLFIYFTPLLP